MSGFHFALDNLSIAGKYQLLGKISLVMKCAESVKGCKGTKVLRALYHVLICDNDQIEDTSLKQKGVFLHYLNTLLVSNSIKVI